VPTTLTPDGGDLAKDAVIEECTLASLEARVRAISPYHIGRVLRCLAVSVFRPSPLSQHAIVPFGFRRQVGWVTQKSVLRTSPLSKRDRATGEMAHVISIAGEHQRSANLFLAPVLQTGFGKVLPFWTDAVRAMIPVVKLV
jgi:hypothetical protein